MHWVLQETDDDERFAELVACLDAIGASHSEHTVIPIVGILIPDIDIDDGKAICIGGHSMRITAKEKGWVPGVFDIIDLDFRVQLAHWGERMLNHGSRVMRFGDVRLNAKTFIRPIDDSKDFAGDLYMPEAFHEWQQRVSMLGDNHGGTLSRNTLVQVAAPKAILEEARYWVVDGEIVTSSVYKTGDIVASYPGTDAAMDDYCRECIAIWQPTDAFVIDICRTPDGFRIIEPNSLNSSGFYACDLQNLVGALVALDVKNKPETGYTNDRHAIRT